MPNVNEPTTEEIATALRVCFVKSMACSECPFDGKDCGDIEGVAADHLESQQREIADLTAKLTAETARADAAVADLNYACGTQPSAADDGSICDICKHLNSDRSCNRMCFMNSLGASNKWKWRGAQEGEK